MNSHALQESAIQCPYCGETITILIDCSITEQEYIEDYQVCCCPIIIQTNIYDDDLSVSARSENE